MSWTWRLTKLTCRNDKSRQFWWSSSPKMPNGKYLVNERILHSVVCSGMLSVHYKQFADGANTGHITDKQQREYFSLYHVYKEAVGEQYNESTSTALQHEIASYNIDDQWLGINIMTDARHSVKAEAIDRVTLPLTSGYHLLTG